MSIDLPGHGKRTAEMADLVPWKAVPELRALLAELTGRWEQVGFFGSSLGAWFGLLAYPEASLAGALLLSPVVDHGGPDPEDDGLGRRQRGAAGPGGEHPHGLRPDPLLEYLEYVRARPVRLWTAPTEILYGGRDHLTDRAAIEAFARRFDCRLTVEPEGEHWFHTPDQLAAADRWQRAALANWDENRTKRRPGTAGTALFLHGREYQNP